MKIEAFDRLYFFYQNYRQRYTVIPITTVRGPYQTRVPTVFNGSVEQEETES